jgi:hypothetical protein
VIKTNSLLEFEENEKLLDDQSLMSNFSTSSKMSLMNLPIVQMETLITNLRENYDYKVSDCDFKVAADQAKALNSKTPTKNRSVQSKDETADNIDSILNKMLARNSLADKSLDEAVMFVKQGTPKTSSGSSSGSKSEQLSVVESRLESETVRRQHCEKQIHELNENLLELRQQLAIAHDLGHKREVYAQTMDTALQKVSPSVKTKLYQWKGYTFYFLLDYENVEAERD